MPIGPPGPLYPMTTENNPEAPVTLTTPDIIVFVMNLPPGSLESIRALEAETGEKYRIMLLWDSRLRDSKNMAATPGIDINVSVDFSKSDKLMAALLPYERQLC